MMEFFGHIFKMAANASNQNKSSLSQQVLFEFDDVDIKFYVFCDAEAMCEVIGEVSGHAHVVAVKDKVMLNE